MRESIENEVRIEDAEPSAVEDMLEYVYTDGIVHLTLEVSPKNEGDFAEVSPVEGESLPGLVCPSRTYGMEGW